jgi:hypothetical protein
MRGEAALFAGAPDGAYRLLHEGAFGAAGGIENDPQKVLAKGVERASLPSRKAM